MSYDDDNDEPDFDEEAESPEPADMDEEDGVDSETCPYCGEMVYEQAVRCPGCGNYISREDSPSPRKSRWFVFATVAVIVVVFVVWVVRGN